MRTQAPQNRKSTKVERRPVSFLVPIWSGGLCGRDVDEVVMLRSAGARRGEQTAVKRTLLSALLIKTQATEMPLK